MVGNHRREHPMQCREQPALLWLQRRPVVDGAGDRRSHAALSHLQAGFGVGRQRAQGRARHKAYFVKQLQVRDQDADESSSTRLIPMMREYTGFNVDQCENLPDNIVTGKPMRVRNPDARDELADTFLHSSRHPKQEQQDKAKSQWPWYRNANLHRQVRHEVSHFQNAARQLSHLL
jgi:antirestriction protein ArdC